MTLKTAFEYIKESSFYTSDRYEWLRPVIEATLNETLTDELIVKTTRLIYESQEQEDEPNEPNEPEAAEPTEQTLDAFTICKIKSINKITNIGLVDVNTPINFKDDLNIIYGKNASGKSSIYTAMCNALGISKASLPNLNKEASEMSVSLISVNFDQNPKELNWPTTDEQDLKGIRIFDSDVCTYLVEKDQLNKFELSHLKSEYFPLLNNVFETISERLEDYKQSLNEGFTISITAIQKAIPQFSETSELFSKDTIESIEITKEQKETLASLKTELKTIQESNPSATCKNIKTSHKAGKDVLNLIGEFNESIDDNGKVKLEWKCKFNNVIAETSSNLKEYIRLKSIVDAEGEKKLGDLLPSDWFNNLKWKDFVEKSIAFIDSLDEKTSQKYKSENCPYCLQSYTSEKTKKLVEAYHTLQNENKIQLEKIVATLGNTINDLNDAIEDLGNIPEYLAVFNSEIESISEENIISIDVNRLETFFMEIIEQIEKKEDKDIDSANIEYLSQFGESILKLEKKHYDVIQRLDGGISARDEKIEKIKTQRSPLAIKQSIIENKKSLLTCIELKKNLDNLKSKIADLTAIKQATSTLSTKFTREVPLDVFKRQLEIEYQALGHTIPDTWSIKSQTDGPKNKRVYSIKDKRISEIFSEGERKVHALADFFTEAEINNFKGVYIFDDPVNSLDEDKIGLVKNRIMKLVDDGNQVFIFTHNLVFLNFLIETEKEKISQVNRLSDQILFEENVILGTDQGLSKRIKAIKKRMTDLNSDEELQRDIHFLRNVYDLISGYLESYVEVKIFFNVINRYRPNIRMHSLNRLKGFDYGTVEHIMKLYHQTSRKGSRHSQPPGAPEPNYDELEEHYKTLIDSYSL